MSFNKMSTQYIVWLYNTDAKVVKNALHTYGSLINFSQKDQFVYVILP